MVIERGREWGVAVERPDDLLVLDSDAELAAAIDGGRPLALAGGDLHRAVGSPALRPTMQRVDVDLVHVVADGRSHRAVAHVVARRSWWRGRLLAVANTDHLGDWNIAPRGHPNDGKLDVVDVDPAMTVRQRWQAHQRLANGTHLPHPMIAVRAVTEATFVFERPLDLRVDGVACAPVSELAVRVEPDAFRLHI